MRIIYLACPYSAIDQYGNNPACRAVMYERYCIANRVAAHLMQKGHIVFSPLSHSVPISRQMSDEYELNHRFWLGQDRYWLDKCSHIYIVAIDGWYDSYGVNWETMVDPQKPIVLIGENYKEYET